MSIHLTDGTIENINADKEISKTGLATLITENKTVNYAGSIQSIHGRGNSTWDQAKKSYSLALPVEADLLGMGAGKEWVLLSNSFDESGLRNKLVYDTAKAIGVTFAVDAEYVDLYIDNVYYGLYLLAKKIYVGNNHVDITNLEEKTKSINPYPLSFYQSFEEEHNGKMIRGYDIAENPKNITGGYLVQIEHHEEKLAARESLFRTDSLSFSVSSPKYASRQQITYLSDYFNTVESQLAEGDLSNINVDSFVKYYLIQELFANKDKNSVFFCKDSDEVDGQVYACSIWDFDLSIGNGWLVSNVNPSVLYRNTDNWFEYLYDNPIFQSRLKEMYASVIKSDLDTLLYHRLEEYRNTVSSSFAMDKRRWRKANNGYTVSDTDKTDSSTWGRQSQHHFETLDEHISYISDFMNQRIQFLDSAWIDDVTYCFVSFSTPENTDYFTVREGDVLTEEPIPSYDNNDDRFIGWYDADGNEYVPNLTVTRSVNYNAKWEEYGDSGSKATALLSLIERIKANPLHESVLLSGGLIIMVCAILYFVITDIRKAKKGGMTMDENRKFRHELKYQCSEAHLAIIRNRLQGVIPYDRHAANGQYTIRSMYFDNFENRCFHENESGTDPREKFRIRIYNADDSRISLECKRKERGKTYKTSCLLSKEEYADIISGGTLVSIDDKAPLLRKFSVLQKTELFRPAVIVEYDRTPYVYKIGNVRITLDRNIRSSNDFAHFFDDNLPTRPIMPKGRHLLEVKYDNLLPDFIKEILQLGDLQQTTFSKYYLCRKYSTGGTL